MRVEMFMLFLCCLGANLVASNPRIDPLGGADYRDVLVLIDRVVLGHKTLQSLEDEDSLQALRAFRRSLANPNCAVSEQFRKILDSHGMLDESGNVPDVIRSLGQASLQNDTFSDESDDDRK